MTRHQNNSTSFIALVLTLAILLCGLLVFGPSKSVDTHRFIEFGEYLVDAWYRQCGPGGCDHTGDSMFPNYVISGIYLWSINEAFPDSPVLAAAIFNVLLFAIAIYLVFEIWGLLLVDVATSRGVMLIAGLYMIFGLPAIPLWSYWMLSETIFLLVVCACIWATIRAVLFGGGRRWIYAAVFAIAGFFVRPTGILLLPLVIIAALLGGNRPHSIRSIRRRFLLMTTTATLFVFICVPLIVAVIFSDSSFNEVLPWYVKFKVSQAAHYYRLGWIIADQPDTYVVGANSVYEFISITIRRFIYYFLPLKSTFSMIHNVVNGVYLVIALTGLYFGLRQLFSAGKRSSVVAYWLVLVALGYGLLHAMTIVSYGWRYQVPAMVPLWILAGIGLMNLGERIKSRKHRVRQ